jgi:DNA-binding transcriptional LysR family regulator
MIETRQFEHFVAVVHHGSFVKAARAVHLSISALSRSIKNLETGLGIRLMERDTRRVELTNAGIIFLGRAKDILTRTSDLEHEVSLLKGLRAGKLGVALGPYAADILLGATLGRMNAAYPMLHVQSVLGSFTMLRQRLKEREIELLIAETTEFVDDPELDIEPLENNQAFVVVRADHPLTKLSQPTFEQVLSYPLVMPGRLVARAIEPMVKFLHAAKPRQVPTLECDNFHIVRTLLPHCDAFTLQRLSEIEEEMHRRILRPLPLTAPWMRTNFGFVQIKGRTLSPAAAEFKRMATAVNNDVILKENELASALIRPARPARRGHGSSASRRRARRERRD